MCLGVSLHRRMSYHRLNFLHFHREMMKNQRR
jgi:hypothetical protein